MVTVTLGQTWEKQEGLCHISGWERLAHALPQEKEDIWRGSSTSHSYHCSLSVKFNLHLKWYSERKNTPIDTICTRKAVTTTAGMGNPRLFQLCTCASISLTHWGTRTRTHTSQPCMSCLQPSAQVPVLSGIYSSTPIARKTSCVLPMYIQ